MALFQARVPGHPAVLTNLKQKQRWVQVPQWLAHQPRAQVLCQVRASLWLLLRLQQRVSLQVPGSWW